MARLFFMRVSKKFAIHSPNQDLGLRWTVLYLVRTAKGLKRVERIAGFYCIMLVQGVVNGPFVESYGGSWEHLPKVENAVEILDRLVHAVEETAVLNPDCHVRDAMSMPSEGYAVVMKRNIGLKYIGNAIAIVERTIRRLCDTTICQTPESQETDFLMTIPSGGEAETSRASNRRIMDLQIRTVAVLKVVR